MAAYYPMDHGTNKMSAFAANPKLPDAHSSRKKRGHKPLQ